jgi:hypothetical protein
LSSQLQPDGDFWKRGGLVVKLADFGTADIDENTIEEPMTDLQVLCVYRVYGICVCCVSTANIDDNTIEEPMTDLQVLSVCV